MSSGRRRHRLKCCVTSSHTRKSRREPLPRTWKPDRSEATAVVTTTLTTTKKSNPRKIGTTFLKDLVVPMCLRTTTLPKRPRRICPSTGSNRRKVDAASVTRCVCRCRSWSLCVQYSMQYKNVRVVFDNWFLLPFGSSLSLLSYHSVPVFYSANHPERSGLAENSLEER